VVAEAEQRKKEAKVAAEQEAQKKREEEEMKRKQEEAQDPDPMDTNIPGSSSGFPLTEGISHWENWG
jgi:hypothetical protein